MSRTTTQHRLPKIYERSFTVNGTRSIDSLVRQEIRYAKTVNRIYNLKRFTFLFVFTLSQANKKVIFKKYCYSITITKVLYYCRLWILHSLYLFRSYGGYAGVTINVMAHASGFWYIIRSDSRCTHFILGTSNQFKKVESLS